jgi:transcriptional repressor of cell division inhibition gene dicB
MKTEQAIQKAGTVKALAELLGITSSAISQWGDEVPETRIWQLRVLRPAWFEEEKQWNGAERRKQPRAA